MSRKPRIRNTTTNECRIVNFRLDTSKPAALSPRTQANLDALKDEDIDTSDIPDQGGTTGWYSPVLRRLLRDSYH